jgi:hypothetical protein
MPTGVLIAERPRTDAKSDGRLVKIARVTRAAVESVTVGQPPVWTLHDFEADEQRAAGLPAPCNGWIGLILSFAAGLHTLYYQHELNQIWSRYGNPPEYAAITLAA